jgi:mono/diheme cytochrome c family protein
MTRQSRARWLAFATAALVVLLAAVFALLRNLHPVHAPARPAPSAPVVRSAQPRVDAGRAAFERMGCAACHAAEGRGNPGLPLDGIGGRRSRDELRASAFAQGGPSEGQAGTVSRIKQSLAGDADADALLDYLQQLK